MVDLESLIQGYHKRLLKINADIRILRSSGSNLVEAKAERKKVNTTLSKLRNMKDSGKEDRDYMNEAIDRYMKD